MRKILKFTVLGMCLTIYVLSCNQPLSNKIALYKLNSTGVFSSDRYRYGDLYGMSHLSHFRKQFRQETMVRYAECKSSNKIDLYAESDSYIWPLFTSPKFYCGVNKLKYIKNQDGYFDSKLDTSQINVLLLEFSERNILNSLNDTSYVNNLINIQRVNKPSVKKTTEQNKDNKVITLLKSIKAVAFEKIFNNKISNNLEANIWDYPFFRPFKELKADMNYYLFNTVDNNVKISGDGKQLYYTTTIDTTNTMSGFRYISETKKDTLVERLNKLYYDAKKYGFNSIYLTIVPNPISILDSHYNGLHYNNLLNRIQNDPKLKMPFINLYPDFMHLKHAVYQASDSHWNRRGAYLWLDKFNNKLDKINSKKPIPN